MNPRKLMAVALCAAACVTTTVFAEDDFGIESASPVVIADPVNPQPGMVFNAYNDCKGDGQRNLFTFEQLQKSNFAVQKLSSLQTAVDKGSEFSLASVKNESAIMGYWNGFLKCKKTNIYTFLLQHAGDGYHMGYALFVNGRLITTGCGDTSCDVNLKIGWNKVEIICQYWNKNSLSISYKPKGSLSEPRPITPKDLFHDQKPEEDW